MTDVLLTNSEQVSDDWGAPRITPGGATTAEWLLWVEGGSSIETARWATTRQPRTPDLRVLQAMAPKHQLQDPDMPLAIYSDLSAADWIVASDLPWQRLVTFGPAGFGSYARVRFIPDPIRDGQQESEADPHASPDEVDQWRALLKLLAAATEDPDHCYFGLWEGWGFPESVRLWPSFGVPRGARPPAGPTSCLADHSRRPGSGAEAHPPAHAFGTPSRRRAW